MGNETSSGQLRPNEIAVLKANTGRSESEIQSLYSNFKTECPSGRMNKTHFLQLYNIFGIPQDKNAVFADSMFSAFDKNNDGTIDFSEFVLACGVLNKKDLDSQFDLVFDMLDTSGDGQINFQEMVKFVDTGRKLSNNAALHSVNSQAVATDIFGGFGVPQTQKLTRKQFIDGCKGNPNLGQMFGFS